MTGCGTRATALLVAFALAACDAPGDSAAAGRGSDDPVATARAFFAAIKRGDCDAAWAFYSSGTREHALARVRQIERHIAYAAEPVPTPQTLFCVGTYGDAKPGSEQLTRQDGATAAVSVLFSEGTHLALIPFLSTPYREWRDEVSLVREGNAWKVDRPRAPPDRPGGRVTPVGAAEVTRHLRGDPRRQWVESEAVVHGSRDAIEAALMDPLAWPRFVPLVRSVEPLSGPDAAGGWRWQVRFLGANGETAATTIHLRPYGRLRDPALPWTTVQWTVEGHPDRGSTPAQPLFTGSFKLRERFEGVWVTFSLVIQPDEWPPGLAQQFLADEAVAAAVTNLQRVVQAESPAP